MRALLSLALFMVVPCVVRAEITSELNEPRMIHLRINGDREWSSFPERPEAESLEALFLGEPNTSELTLSLRQHDVKQLWHVRLNDKRLGDLVRDENEMTIYLPIPPGTLVDGINALRIEQVLSDSKSPDDIRVGELRLLRRTMKDVTSESNVEIQIVDTDSRQPLPSRLTILNASGVLQTVGAASNDHLAVRAGVVYTSTGQATFGLPAGKYTVIAGRGFEYSQDTVDVTVESGQAIQKTLSIRREVPTEGYVACDTHVHTLTHSGHGDATIEERMITLAGEGIELPIATDHNVQIDYEPIAKQMNVRQYFTPVIGNEVTTKFGHFNVFPLKTATRPPNHELGWHAVLLDIHRTPEAKVAILNHARDLHSGTRPFGPKEFNSASGEFIGKNFHLYNAMEVINSGATQTDVLQLFRDWMAVLNTGHSATPVGASDSHDVARYVVGQGRTYIRTGDRDAGSIDRDEAVNSFVQGRVMVAYGLMTELTVNGKYGPGELAPFSGREVIARIRVLGPHWATVDRVQLYQNGTLIREEEVLDKGASGVKWEGEWSVTHPLNDVHLVAIALGPGIESPAWNTAKPYQPTSPDWTPHVIGCSGAVRIDVDGDGQWTSASGYLLHFLAEFGNANLVQEFPNVIRALQSYDESVAIQVASVYDHEELRRDPKCVEALQGAAPHVRAGFQRYFAADRENRMARNSQ